MVILGLRMIPSASAESPIWSYEMDQMEPYAEVYDDDRWGESARPYETLEDSAATEESYEVIIPPTVSLHADDNQTDLNITGKVQPYRTLNISVASPNDAYELKPSEESAYCIDYGITLNEGTEITADKAENRYQVVTGEEAKEFEASITIQVTDRSQALVSGDYTDTLTFQFDCQNQIKTYQIDCYLESIQSYSFGNINDHKTYEKVPTTVSMELIAGKTYQWTLNDLIGNNILTESDQDNFEDAVYSFQAPASNETPISLYINRKLVCVDLNCRESQGGGEYPWYGNTSNFGTVKIYANNIFVSSGNTTDYYRAHPLGSTITLSDITVKDGYRLVGYVGGEFSQDRIQPYNEGGEINLTVDTWYTTTQHLRIYDVVLVFEKDPDQQGVEDLSEEPLEEPEDADAPMEETME